MEDLIRKFGNVTIDVREIACIGERVNLNGFSCCVHIYLKRGEKVSAVFGLTEGEESGGSNGPTPGKLMDRVDKEINWLALIWKQATQ